MSVSNFDRQQQQQADVAPPVVYENECLRVRVLIITGHFSLTVMNYQNLERKGITYSTVSLSHLPLLLWCSVVCGAMLHPVIFIMAFP